MAAPHSSVARASLRSLPAYDDDRNVGPLALPVTVTAGQASATPAAVVAQQAGWEIHCRSEVLPSIYSASMSP